VRGVYPLIAEVGGRFAQSFPRVEKILGEIPCKRRLGGRPAIVRFAFPHPLFAVIALVPSHQSILRASEIPIVGWQYRLSIKSTCFSVHVYRTTITELKHED
jgi:hypothetical protein